ncbi:hypothetical protein FQR65_LT04139 [Abscondita terminalis]|nr:hypothetical protein FQR65_LT04139 [Abscondita terminalis]
MNYTLQLPEGLQIIAKNELNEVPERVQEDIAYIRRWLLKQPHIHARLDDATLLMHLRGCKFSLEKTKRKLEVSHAIKSAFPNVFRNRDPLLPNLQCILKQNIVAVLPETSNGPLWVLFRIENATPETLSVSDFIKLSTIVTDVTLRECISSSIAGRAVLLDLKNMSPGFFTLITPTTIKQYITCHLNVYPLRLKAIHLINFPTILVPLMNLFKKLIGHKLGNRVILYSAENTVTRYLPLSILPSEFGGTGEPFVNICEKLRTKIESYRDWLIEDEQYGCDESKRPATSIVDIDLFSIDGSFRKINVD